jgi:putative ABC transport system permease protein
VQLKITAWDVYWLGVAVALKSSAIVFGVGALYLFRRLKIQAAQLLKEGV